MYSDVVLINCINFKFIISWSFLKVVKVNVEEPIRKVMIWLFYILKWTGIYKNVKKNMNWNRYHIEQIQLDYTCTSITEKKWHCQQTIYFWFLYLFIEIIERNQSNLLNEVVENRKERALLMVSVQQNTVNVHWYLILIKLILCLQGHHCNESTECKYINFIFWQDELSNIQNQLNGRNVVQGGK